MNHDYRKAVADLAAAHLNMTSEEIARHALVLAEELASIKSIFEDKKAKEYDSLMFSPTKEFLRTPLLSEKTGPTPT
ncbi:MAG: hypothetical protein E5V60_15175 [Mesorhizobium sp.]|uniref:hypothetical protein n=1 Tax=Mesorhizobium sp. M4A.F.Ca.ET.090.04.2.1 TaxID=2496663 RepID=UPI000FCB71DF|nr:hypothetical protein [Mesorhizobium sp. M4A.F.Ca.ET.090.04.2.1]RVC45102.1 hypothetical protein EN781_11235 [Mesorhizobium sp. M4A.F.Ca.ET.090.04.2.1]TIW65709.1 MAG: hypothetical protein E5V60_15175 [Mesorhizobium sp.]